MSMTYEEALNKAVQYADIIISQQTLISHLQSEVRYLQEDLIAEKKRTSPSTNKTWNELTSEQVAEDDVRTQKQNHEALQALREKLNSNH